MKGSNPELRPMELDLTLKGSACRVARAPRKRGPARDTSDGWHRRVLFNLQEFWCGQLLIMRAKSPPCMPIWAGTTPQARD